MRKPNKVVSMQTYRFAVNHYAHPARAYHLLNKLIPYTQHNKHNYAVFQHNSKIIAKLDTVIK